MHWYKKGVQLAADKHVCLPFKVLTPSPLQPSPQLKLIYANPFVTTFSLSFVTTESHSGNLSDQVLIVGQWSLSIRDQQHILFRKVTKVRVKNCAHNKVRGWRPRWREKVICYLLRQWSHWFHLGPSDCSKWGAGRPQGSSMLTWPKTGSFFICNLFYWPVFYLPFFPIFCADMTQNLFLLNSVGFCFSKSSVYFLLFVQVLY